MVDMRGRFLEIFVRDGGCFGMGTGISDGGEQETMDDHVGVSANGRGEMRVKAESESVMKELVARHAARGEVGGDGHGVRGQIT